MSNVVGNAAVAIFLGVLLAVAGFVPAAAIAYRRRGTFPLVRILLLLAATIYAVALWAYTLLPVPDVGSYVCAGTQFRPFGFLDDILRAREEVGARALLTSAAFLQVALNVVLFVPLGFFVRAIAGRGVLVAGALGLATSLLIETTQLTGIWGLYPCAYRVFDVDDLMINTVGAVIGSVISVRLVRHRPREAPTTVTVGRRLVGMTTDLLVVLGAGAPLALAWRAWQLYGLDVPYDQIPATTQFWLLWGPPIALEAVAVLGFGRTVGEWVVGLRATASSGVWWRRIVKLLTGAGGLTLLLMTDFPGSGLLLLAFVLATVVTLPRTRDHRGLSNAISGMEVSPVRPAVSSSS
ncbi:VanZ family protein [Nocardioides sp. NPDC101246]|uniref:VanZ family protein n=1 Tax=Nocardioides sp. NPDC101246 TaxID=3364336 RepID=UPI0037FFD746